MKILFLPFIIILSIQSICQTSGIKLSNKSPEINSGSVQTNISRDGKTKPVYQTPEIILYNYNASKISVISNNLITIKNDLYQNSKDPAPANQYNETKVATKLQEIETLQKEIVVLEKKQDSLFHIYTKDYLQYKRVNIFNFGINRSEAFFDYIYGDNGGRFNVLNNTGISFGNNSGALYSELVSGNMGVLRISFGTMIAKSMSEDSTLETQSEAFQRLTLSGGNTVLNIEYPLAYIHSRNYQYNLLSRIIIKGAADFPPFGTNTDEFSGNASIGLDIYADASLKNDEMRFFTNFNIRQITGTERFQENLGLNNRSLYFGQLTLGLVISNNIKLSCILGTFSSQDALKNNNVIIGGQILH
mgnify:CR=1 FL=1